MIKTQKKPKSKGIKLSKKMTKNGAAQVRNAIYQNLSLEDKLARQVPGGKVYNKLKAQEAK